ncbi:MAG: hypothetical protein AMXMBFR33_32930 [Candidatus Xenobia bacterium]
MLEERLADHPGGDLQELPELQSSWGLLAHEVKAWSRLQETENEGTLADPSTTVNGHKGTLQALVRSSQELELPDAPNKTQRNAIL